MRTLVARALHLPAIVCQRFGRKTDRDVASIPIVVLVIHVHDLWLHHEAAYHRRVPA